MLLKRVKVWALLSVGHVIFLCQTTTFCFAAEEKFEPRMLVEEPTPELFTAQEANVSPTPTSLIASSSSPSPSLIAPSSSPSPSNFETAYVHTQPASLPSDEPSVAPSMYPSVTAHGASTVPSLVPSQPIALSSDGPSIVPSSNPSKHFNTDALSDGPSFIPSLDPSNLLVHTLSSDWPSVTPSIHPSTTTNLISDAPSAVPSYILAGGFSDFPSTLPTIDPSSLLAAAAASDGPSLVPSDKPSVIPSSVPSLYDPLAISDVPSSSPSSILGAGASDYPSLVPSIVPSLIEATTSDGPSFVPSDAPSVAPSVIPSTHNPPPSIISPSAPSASPSSKHVVQGSDYASLMPSKVPSSILAASDAPLIAPSDVPLIAPSDVPSTTPSDVPSAAPSTRPGKGRPTPKKPTNRPKSATRQTLTVAYTVTLLGVSQKMDNDNITVFEKTSETFLSHTIPAPESNKITIANVTVSSQTVLDTRKRRHLQQTGLGVTLTVTAFVPVEADADVKLAKVVSSAFEAHQDEFNQMLFAASPFFATIHTKSSVGVKIGGSQPVDGQSKGSKSTIFGGKLNIVAGASVAVLVASVFGGWWIRKSRSGHSGKSIDVEKSHSDDDGSWAPTASPNSLEAANARGFGSSDESEATESSLSSYSSGDSSDDYLAKAGSNRYGPNGERSVEEEIENVSKNEQQLSPISEIGPPTITFSNCSSVSPVSVFSQVKAKVTPRGTKFVQFQVKNDPPEIGEELLSQDEEDEQEEHEQGCRNDTDNSVASGATIMQKQQPPATPDDYTISSFSSLSAALSCGLRYNDALDIVRSAVTDTPKQARLEDCDVKTPRGEFIQHNCTPDGTTFVQLNTESAQDVGEVLSDLTDMEHKWEGKLDSKTTAVSETPKTNNLQKFKKAPRKVIYQPSARLEL